MQQQRFRRVALFIGGATLIGGGFIMVACGTDNGTTATPQLDGSGGGKDTGGGGMDSTMPEQDGEVPDGESADCATAPQLRSNTAAGGFFCAFYKSDGGVDGAASLGNCVTGQTCCNPGIADGGTFNGKFPPAFCADTRGDDTTCQTQAAAHGSEYQPGFFSNAWQCNDKTACQAGEICVMYTSKFVSKPSDVTNVGKDTKAPAACNQYKAYKQGGSKCKAPPAAADEVQLCSLSDTGNCGAGTTCQPFNGNGRDLGSCR